jgi:hypothetical protein
MSETVEYYFIHIVSVKEHIQSGFGNQNNILLNFVLHSVLILNKY